MFVDLDNFKNINDTLGHNTGDKLLKRVAQRIAESVRESDTVARWGGDEFLIIVPDLTQTIEAEAIAEKILMNLSRLIQIDENEFNVSASIGIAAFPEDGESSEELLSNADAAMYEAKNAGKNTFRHYTFDMNIIASHKMEMEAQLRHAVEKNELCLYYQPLINIVENKVIGCEALLRWDNGKFGMVPPDIFIPIAEDSGLINGIGDWVMKSVCHTLAQWDKKGLTELRVAMNISSRQLKDVNFIYRINKLVEDNQLDPTRLIIEITEGVLLQDDPYTLKVVKQLDEMGYRLSLDDFGTGYSSLSYLKKFPFKEIKIDKSFVRDSTTDENDAALCKAIIAMARSLNLEVVGEGVESLEHLEFLKENNTRIVQGFYFSVPLPADDFYEYVKGKN